MHFTAVRCIVHERVPDAPAAGIHQVARMGEPGVAIGFEKEPGFRHAIDRVRRNGGEIEGLGCAVGVVCEENDMPRQQEQAQQHPEALGIGSVDRAERGDIFHGRYHSRVDASSR